MSFDKDNAETAGDRLLLLLKTKGALPTSALASELGITVEGVRQHVQRLSDAGLVQAGTAQRRGVGRPRREWALTASGHARFPDAHAQLMVQLIASARRQFGEVGLDKLIADREAEMQQAYTLACAGRSSLGAKLVALANIRTSEGYMARATQDGQDWLLTEDHCPICAAAKVCQGFCRSELSLFRAVLGDDVAVEREEHLLQGSKRCVYRIRRASKG